MSTFSCSLYDLVGLLDGDECKLPPPKKLLDDGFYKKLKNYLHGVESHKISELFEPVRL